MTIGAEQVHQRSGDDARRAPSACSRAADGERLSRNLRISKSSMPKAFTTRLPLDGFLQNLAQLAETGLAVFRGTANFAAEFADRHRRREEGERPSRGPCSNSI